MGVVLSDAQQLLDEDDECEHAADEKRNVDARLQRADDAERDGQSVHEHHVEGLPPVRVGEQAEVEEEKRGREEQGVLHETLHGGGGHGGRVKSSPI